MGENLVVVVVAGVAVLFILRRAYRSLMGRGKQCTCAKDSCSVSTQCDSLVTQRRR